MSYEHIQGAEALQRRLLQLPAKLEKNILRGALRAGAKVFQQAAKEEVPKRTGRLARSLRVSTRSRRGLVTASAKAGNAEAFYSAIVQRGSRAHDIPKRGSRADRANRRGLSFNGRFVQRVRHPGARANPFMKRALDRGTQPAIAAVAEYIRQRLHKLDTPSE